MKRILFSLLLLGAVGVASAQVQSLTVEVSNQLNMERENESVEIDWDDVKAAIKGITVDNVVVFAMTNGRQVPVQVLYDGDKEPESLLFQATVKPQGVATYRVKIGERMRFKDMTFGRFVPERKDDFAWENNKVAYRVYGPALEDEMFSPGIDVWMKRTPNLIINKWYKAAHYHQDHGEGLDMYDVGSSLGVGATTPIVGGKLIYPSRNFAKYKILDKGVLRIKFEVEFPTFKVKGKDVEHKRTVTLDANRNLNIVEAEYEGDFKEMDIAVGLKIRNKEGEVAVMGDNYLSYQEPVKGNNGTTYVLAVTPNAGENKRIKDHIIKTTTVKEGEDYTYLCGGYWSKYGVKDGGAWKKIVDDEVAKFQSPLVVKIK